MFPSWRLKIREAQVALKEGRWDEASALLGQESVRDFLPARRLSHKVASHLVERAQQRMEQGESSAGWRDLQQASRLGGCDDRVTALRDAHTRRGLERVKQLISCGETKLAGQQIARLEQRRLGGDERRVWKLIVQQISQAKLLSHQGAMSEAAKRLRRAERLLPDPNDPIAADLSARQANLEQQAGKVRTLSVQLHENVASEAWSEVLQTAEALLELAPEHKAANKARRRAWKAVGLGEAQAFRDRELTGSRRLGKQATTSTRVWTSSAKVDTVSLRNRQEKKMSGKRIVAWIDEVGGFLICLGEEVMLGQPSTSGADIPFLADLSRQHATIRREGESYVLTPIHRVSINGKTLVGPTVLNDGVQIELEGSVRLKFRRPHALSATAVLTIESHHKTDPAVDGIVLMSESCILGPQAQSHIYCRKWANDLVLFRRGDDLQFRTAGSVEIDGEPASRGATLAGTCQVAGEDFALSFEEI